MNKTKKKKEFNFYTFLRQGLRSLSRKFPPIYECLAKAKRPAPKDAPPRQKIAYLCAICGKLNSLKNICVDHKIPAGALLREEDITPFVLGLFCSEDNLQAICKDTCHRYKTMSDRLGISFEEAKLECSVLDLLKSKQKALDKLREFGYTGDSVSNQVKRRDLLREILKHES